MFSTFVTKRIMPPNRVSLLDFCKPPVLMQPSSSANSYIGDLCQVSGYNLSQFFPTEILGRTETQLGVSTAETERNGKEAKVSRTQRTCDNDSTSSTLPEI
jgi:hypothetical protein